MQGQAAKHDLIRLEFLGHAGTGVPIAPHANSKADAETYVRKYFSREDGVNFDISACCDNGDYNGGTGNNVARFNGKSNNDAGRIAEHLHRCNTLFDSCPLKCLDWDAVAPANIRKVVHTNAANANIEIKDGTTAAPGPGTIPRMRNSQLAATGMMGTFDEAKDTSEANTVPRPVADLRLQRTWDCNEYLREWNKLSNHARLYVLARMAGFDQDPMDDTLPGNGIEDYKEVMVRCKVQVSPLDQLKNRAGITFAKQNSPATNVSYNFGTTHTPSANAFLYASEITIPTLQKGTEYYLDYRPHRSAIGGLTFASMVAVAGANRTHEAQNRSRVYASHLFGYDDNVSDLFDAGDDVYKKVDNEAAGAAAVARLDHTTNGGGAVYPRRFSFMYAADLHKAAGRYQATNALQAVLVREPISVLGYTIPFKIIGTNPASVRVGFAPMMAHVGFHDREHPVHNTTTPRTHASILSSLTRPSQRNVIGMALQSIPPGKAGDVILYDTS